MASIITYLFFILFTLLIYFFLITRNVGLREEHPAFTWWEISNCNSPNRLKGYLLPAEVERVRAEEPPQWPEVISRTSITLQKHTVWSILKIIIVYLRKPPVNIPLFMNGFFPKTSKVEIANEPHAESIQQNKWKEST
jgi:hypothetical protein